jgi:hypothetical protein
MERPERAGVCRINRNHEAVRAHRRVHLQRSHSRTGDRPHQARQLCTSRMPRYPGFDQRTRERVLSARQHADDLQAHRSQARPAVVRVSLRLRDSQGRRQTARPGHAPRGGDAIRRLQVRGRDDVVSWG